MTKMLASVTGIEEAQVALRGGVDIIDPEHQGHRRAAGFNLDAVNAVSSCRRTQRQDDTARCHLDVLGTPCVGVRKDSGSPRTPS